MGLKNKASMINLSDLDKPAVPTGAEVSPESTAPSSVTPSSTSDLGGVSRRALRSGVAAIQQSISSIHRIEDLEAENRQLRAAAVVVKLDPRKVRQSKWKNRDERAYATKEFAELKQEISDAGENVQPIKVRRIAGTDEFEIVFGRRRLRACLELGLPVNGIIEQLDDAQSFIEMARENRNRADLSPWEQGEMYKDALNSGLFPSQRQLAARLGINQALVSQAISLADLPPLVVRAFSSPLDLQFRFAQLLQDALTKDAGLVTKEAEDLAALQPGISAQAVMNRLLAVGARDDAPKLYTHEFKVGGKAVGSLVRDRKGGVTLKLRGGTVAAGKEKKLVELVEQLLKN